jgi:predicted nuclease of predicted toxin-antitoxin system
VEFVLETSPGADDVDVFVRAQRDGRTIITDDRDFGTLVIQQGLGHAGVMLLRTRNLDPNFKADRVMLAIATYGAGLSTAFVVIEDAALRTRVVPST